MKQRLLAILLAGILTASLTSCFGTTSTKKPNKTGDPNIPQQTQGQTTTQSPTQIEYTDVNETVFVTVSTLNLRRDPATTEGAIQVPQLTKLRRVKYSQTWSVVEHEGIQYYAKTEYLTTDDLLGETFTALPAEKTMYANDGVNVRPYPSADDTLSPAIMTLKKNDEVVAVATSADGKWVKIKNPKTGEGFAFVRAGYLSDEKEASLDEQIASLKASLGFETCNPMLTMYVINNSVNFRTVPSLGETSSTIRQLEIGTAVTVKAIATVADEEGILWAEVRVADIVNPGDTQTYTDGYISTKYLSETAIGTSVTLEEMLEQYTNFTAKEQSLYASGNVNVRVTPKFLEDGSNLSSIALSKGNAVSVVAVANEADADGIVWYMIHCKDAEDKDLFLFVSGKFLTPDPSGNEAFLTIDDLLRKYTDFEAVTLTKEVTSEVANCNTTPANAETPALVLKRGDRVSVVAEGTVSGASWYVIQTEDGFFYFVGSSHFGDVAAN